MYLKFDYIKKTKTFNKKVKGGDSIIFFFKKFQIKNK